MSYCNYQIIEWKDTLAAVWRPKQRALRAMRNIAPINIKSLIGIDRQQQALLHNTARFIEGKLCNNALSWGSRGTGKSSLVKIDSINDEPLRPDQALNKAFITPF